MIEKEQETIDKYQPLKDEIARLWNMKKVKIIPIIVGGALGTVSKNFGKYIERTGMEQSIEHAQKDSFVRHGPNFKVSARTMIDI